MGGSRSRMPTESVSGKGFSLPPGWYLFPLPSMEKRKQGQAASSPYKGTHLLLKSWHCFIVGYISTWTSEAQRHSECSRRGIYVSTSQILRLRITDAFPVFSWPSKENLAFPNLVFPNVNASGCSGKPVIHKQYRPSYMCGYSPPVYLLNAVPGSDRKNNQCAYG
jgi:hypothetical protein